MTLSETALPELLPSVRALSRADKLRLIQLLAGDLAQEDQMQSTPGSVFPIWTPLHAFDAATVMLGELQRSEMAK